VVHDCNPLGEPGDDADVVLDQGRVVHEGDARVLLADPERVRRFLGVAGAE